VLAMGFEANPDGFGQAAFSSSSPPERVCSGGFREARRSGQDQCLPDQPGGFGDCRGRTGTLHMASASHPTEIAVGQQHLQCVFKYSLPELKLAGLFSPSGVQTIGTFGQTGAVPEGSRLRQTKDSLVSKLRGGSVSASTRIFEAVAVIPVLEKYPKGSIPWARH